MELEERERFTLIDPGLTTVRLVPSARLLLGKRLRLTVQFKDGDVPTRASFALVVHPAEAEPLVEVYRRKRTVESYRQEAREAQEDARQCREENERLRAESKGAGGLTGLLATHLMDGKGVTARDISKSVVRRSGDSLSVKRVYSYRSAGRVAVDVFLATLDDAQPWMAEGAALTSTTGDALRVLSVWQPELLPGGSGRFLVVEAAATADDARGPFTLKLWEAGGKRTVTLGNVTFP